MRRYRIRMVSFRESCVPTSRSIVHGDGWWFEHQVVAPDGRIVSWHHTLESALRSRRESERNGGTP